LESGEKRALSDVQVGDLILGSDPKGNFSFSAVLHLPHSKNSELVVFLELVTEDKAAAAAEGGGATAAAAVGKQMKKRLDLTPDHLLPRCNGAVVTARAIGVGDCLLTIDGPETVFAITASHKAGVYTAITANKFIVVNGVVASSFGQDRDTEREFHRKRRRLERQRERKLQRRRAPAFP
jgi:hypothetical protein